MNRLAYIEKYNDYFHKTSVKVTCLCGSSEHEALFDKDRNGLKSPTVVCRQCGLVFACPRPTDEVITSFYQSDEYRLFYGDFSNLDEARTYLEEKFRLSNFIYVTCIKYLSHIHKPKVLEFGAAGGWNLYPFIETCDVCGIDYSSILCKLGRERGIHLLQGGLEQLENLPNDFHLIIANHVIEHFGDFRKSMRKLIEKGLEGSLVYLGVPNIERYGQGQIQNAHNFYFSRSTFVYYCTELNLEPLQLGDDDFQFHQFGLFRIRNTTTTVYSRPIDLSSEFNKIKRLHSVYLFKQFVKQLVGPQFASVIRRILDLLKVFV